MEKIVFERLIDLNHTLKELISISVNDHLQYRDDLEGKRAVGRLEISGEYLKLASKDRFNDEIEVDILAPFDRLEENERFYLEIQDFDYHIQNGNLNLEIQVNAHGVGEKKERHIIIDSPDDDEQALLKEIQDIVSKNQLIATMEKELEETAEVREDEEILEKSELEDVEVEILEEVEPVVVEEIEQEAIEETEESRDENEIEEISEEVSIDTEDKQVTKQEVLSSEAKTDDFIEIESVDVEDLFDDDEMAFVTYPIYVVQAGDSYEKIAQRYQIDEKTLMDYNQHVSLKPHQLLVIPPK